MSDTDIEELMLQEKEISNTITEGFEKLKYYNAMRLEIVTKIMEAKGVNFSVTSSHVIVEDRQMSKFTSLELMLGSKPSNQPKKRGQREFRGRS